MNFDPTLGPGQLTKKDCWISATTIGIYMALGDIPNINVKDNIVTLNNDINITLISTPKSKLEAAIRALRVYFAKASEKSPNLYQKDMTLEKIEHYGSPDIISQLLLRKNFIKYCCHKFCFSRVFYQYLCSYDLITLLKSKTLRDIILCTFSFNPSHLYVMIEYKENNLISIIDVSSPDLVIREIKLEYLYMLIYLQI